MFSKFWQNCQQKIVLNTETKDFSYPGLNITSTKVYEDNPNRRLAWGECLLRCLNKVETEIVLYLQDDYFINAPVDVKQIDEFVELMFKDGISHISLVDFSNHGPWHPAKYPLLWEIDQKTAYRISLQAGLWRKDRLQFYLRKHENPWQFEVWGSKRAHRVKDSILCVNRDIFNQQNRQVISYAPTGIIKGKWNKKAVYDLFLKNGIDMDFSRRGFYDPKRKENVKKAPLITRITSRLRSAI